MAVFATAGVVVTNALVDRLVGPPATSPAEGEGGMTQEGEAEGAASGGAKKLELAAFVSEEGGGADREL